DVAAMARRNVEDAHRSAALRHPLHRRAQQLLQMNLSLANAAPSDRLQIDLVDQTAERTEAARRIAIDVVERGAGIEAGAMTEADAVGEETADLHVPSRH